MNPPPKTCAPEASDVAKRRLLGGRGDPFLFAKWERLLFLHFLVEPELVKPRVPAPFELELYEGSACISLAAVTMRAFRPCRAGSIAGLFRAIREQRFLNFRTYVRFREEPGVLFLWGWLSQALALPLPSGMLGLSYAFASLEYDHRYEAGTIRGSASAGSAARRFAYHASVEPGAAFGPCDPGSLAEFAMERCTGFFSRGRQPYVFRAWHPPWLQAPVDATIEADNLITTKFPWFKEASLASANFAPGFGCVWLGRAHRLPEAFGAQGGRRGALSAFYEMP